jgi:hypothetical protein
VKVTGISAEDIERMPEFIERWTSYGLSNESADRLKAEDGVRECYRTLGLSAPKLFIWCDSPLCGALAYLTLMALSNSAPERTAPGAYIGSRLWRLRDAVVGSIRAVIGGDLFGYVTRNLCDVVDRVVYDRVEAIVAAGVRGDFADGRWVRYRDIVRGILDIEVPDAVWAEVQARVAGDKSLTRVGVVEGLPAQGMAGWLSLFDYSSAVCGVVGSEAASGWIQVGRSCGWWWPLERACLMTERHNRLILDSDAELHSQTGLAVAYPDGWGVCCWHGVQIPEWVVAEPEKITTESVLTAQNPGIRAAMVAQFGEDRFSRESGIRVLALSDYRHWLMSAQSSDPVKRTVALRSGRSSRPSLYIVRVPGVDETA